MLSRSTDRAALRIILELALIELEADRSRESRAAWLIFSRHPEHHLGFTKLDEAARR
jgi:hypothetical protein